MAHMTPSAGEGASLPSRAPYAGQYLRASTCHGTHADTHGITVVERVLVYGFTEEPHVHFQEPATGMGVGRERGTATHESARLRGVALKAERDPAGSIDPPW